MAVILFRSSQTINREPSTHLLIQQAISLSTDLNHQETTKDFHLLEANTKKKKRGLISSLKRPLKKFNNSRINTSHPHTPGSNNNSSQAPKLNSIELVESPKSKKSLKKASSLLSITSSNYDSHSSIQSASGGSNFSLNKLIHRKNLKKLAKSERYANLTCKFLYLSK